MDRLALPAVPRVIVDARSASTTRRSIGLLLALRAWGPLQSLITPFENHPTLLLTAAKHIGIHRDNDDSPGHHHLPFLRHGEDAQPVREHAHDEGPDDGPQDSAFPPAEGGAADDHRGDGVEFVASSQGRL